MALLERQKLAGSTLRAEEISFQVAPPLNAAGRMGSADVALTLLTTEDAEEDKQLATQLIQQNRKRQAVEREALKRALAKVSREVNFSQDRVIVLEDEGWHPGVVGIVATRLLRRFHRLDL